MKRKEAVGEDDSLPGEITAKLDSLTAEDLKVCWLCQVGIENISIAYFDHHTVVKVL